ncbi:MAG TPA: hypothetical protein QGG32_03645, partial [Rhodospirillales bacterium]|nr:hypothetical protein [Rhodospirillales bacterium]
HELFATGPSDSTPASPSEQRPTRRRVRQRLHPAIELEEGPVKLQPNIEQRDQRMRQGGVGLDWFTGGLIKGAVAEALAQLDAEHL